MFKRAGQSNEYCCSIANLPHSCKHGIYTSTVREGGAVVSSMACAVVAALAWPPALLQLAPRWPSKQTNCSIACGVGPDAPLFLPPAERPHLELRSHNINTRLYVGFCPAHADSSRTGV
jgi:hypothetical protein